MKKKFFKSLLGLCCCLILAAAGAVSAAADIIYTPTDSFYFAHSGSFRNEVRVYTADNEENQTAVWKTPDAIQMVVQVENGTTLSVQYVYTDNSGREWGDISGFSYNGKTYDSAYVPLDTVTVIYDSISFTEEHQSELRLYSGEFADYTIRSRLVIWKYPNAESKYDLDDLTDFNCNDLSFDYIYVDGSGYIWGYTSFYYRGHYDGWICISYPEETTLPPEDSTLQPYNAAVVTAPPDDSITVSAPQDSDGGDAEESQNDSQDSAESESTPSESSVSQESESSAASAVHVSSAADTAVSVSTDRTALLIIAIALVAAAAVGTGILIHFFWRKKRSEDKPE